MAKEEDEEEEEPVSPTGRLMHAPNFDIYIILFMGYNTKIDPTSFKKCMLQTMLKHPRASSILVTSKGEQRWRQTAVEIDNHVFVPDVGAAAAESPDEFVAEFATNLSEIPMDARKPLWEFHILNVKTTDAESVVVMKIHHSMGDGVSLVALMHACSTRIGDPDSLPEFPAAARKRREGGGGAAARLLSAVWTAVLIVVYTLMDVTAFVATLFFLRDEQTPIKGGRGGVRACRKRFVHRIVSLDDVKLVKTAMNVSFNDVVFGVTEAGLSRYLNTIYEKNKENGKEREGKRSKSLPRNLGVRSTVVFNLRPSPTIEDLVEIMEKEELNGKWGNSIAIVLLPITIKKEEDPLKYIHRAKSIMDRKKLSLAHKCAFFVMKLMISLFGVKAAALATRTIFRNTTFTFSNVMGPKEEVNLFGHHLSYIAPSIYGFPQSLAIHCLSYGDKLVISIGADEKLIPNPYLLCDDLIKSLQIMKEAVIKRGLLEASQLC